MELHEQQQQHLQPDVIPTPYTTRPRAESDADGCVSLNSVDVDKQIEVRNAGSLSPEDSPINQQSTTDLTVRTPNVTEGAGGDNGPVCEPSYNFGQYPMTMTCPCCDYTILTYVQFDVSMKQYMICVMLCLCFLWPCSIIPCVFRGMFDVYHFCPVCRRLIGVYKA